VESYIILQKVDQQICRMAIALHPMPQKGFAKQCFQDKLLLSHNQCYAVIHIS